MLILPTLYRKFSRENVIGQEKMNEIQGAGSGWVDAGGLSDGAW
jgi:hypothetical protein